MKKINRDYSYEVTGNELKKIKDINSTIKNYGRPRKEDKYKLKHRVTLTFPDGEWEFFIKEAGLVPIAIYLKSRLIKKNV